MDKERSPAVDWAALNTGNMGYGIGVGASQQYPQAVLGMDRHVQRVGQPSAGGPFQGLNSLATRAPMYWIEERSGYINAAGNQITFHKSAQGNLLFVDGSVMTVKDVGLNTVATNGADPSGNLVLLP